MRLWELPGPRRFVATICSQIGEGSSVVARFPGGAPSGFEDALASALGNMLTMTPLKASNIPMEDLLSRFIPDCNARLCTLMDICQDDHFQGRLICLDGVNSTNWPSWKGFLEQYSQATRSMSVLGRTLFLVPLIGTPPESPPETDVALNTVEWDGLPDPVDLIMFANELLQNKGSKDIQRRLLVMTVAEVASWDFESAALLLKQDKHTILSPVELLRDIAKGKGWTSETPMSWEFGTTSKSGVAHPAYAAIQNPPREIDRRLWSAQASTLLPWIERRRYDAIERNLFEIRGLLNNCEDDQRDRDPFDLEVGELCVLFGVPGVNRDARRQFHTLRHARNALAHLSPLTAAAVLRLISSD